MAISRYTTRVLIGVLRTLFAPKKFFLDRFFTSTQYSDSEYIEIDLVTGTRRMAPFQSYNAQGKLIDPRGFTTRAYKPAYLKPKSPIKPSDAQDRLPGESPYSDGGAVDRFMAKVTEFLADHRTIITRRLEWMAAQAVLTGQVVIADGESGISDTIDFGMDANHKVTLAGTDVWSDTDDCTPLDDLEDGMSLVAKDSGLTVDTIVMGTTAWREFQNTDQVKAALDSRRIERVSLMPPSDLPQGVRHVGWFDGLPIFTYPEWYIDDAGSEQPMMPVDKVLLGASDARCTRHFGAIQDRKALGLRTDIFPKIWEEEDPSVTYLMTQCAPLMIPHQADGFYILTT